MLRALYCDKHSRKFYVNKKAELSFDPIGYYKN